MHGSMRRREATRTSRPTPHGLRTPPADPTRQERRRAVARRPEMSRAGSPREAAVTGVPRSPGGPGPGRRRTFGGSTRFDRGIRVARRPRHESTSSSIPDVQDGGRAFLILARSAIPHGETLSLVEALGLDVRLERP